MATRFCVVIGSCLLVLGLLASPARADDLATARALIAKQTALIKKGDVTTLKASFTKRLQDRITEHALKSAQAEVGKLSLDELVASVAAKGDELKVRMKNGRTLTTLVKVDGVWLADAIWFK